MITSVTLDGTTHRIARYAGDNSAPLALRFLEQWIDEMANTSLWTGIEPDISVISNGMDTPVITLQRERRILEQVSVYSVAAYEDGTVVYTGIAHVSVIGVQVLETDAPASRASPKAHKDSVILTGRTVTRPKHHRPSHGEHVRSLGRSIQADCAL